MVRPVDAAHARSAVAEPPLTPLAHVALDGRMHSLEEHLHAVARRARANAEAFDGEAHAEIAGLWHDLGKYARDFQDMIRAATGVDAHLERDDDVSAKRKVDHSTAGAFHAATRDGANGLPIVFAIAGHHAGLADHKPKLVERLTKPERGRARLDAALATKPPEDILARAVPTLPDRLRPASADDLARCRRDLELFTRMIFSALCDADFLDTEAFFDEGRAALRGGHGSLDVLAARLSARVDRLTRFDTEVNRARAEIRAACVAGAHRPRGLLTLTVPTGGGKTLAAMELALAHTIHHRLRRVVVATEGARALAGARFTRLDLGRGLASVLAAVAAVVEGVSVSPRIAALHAGGAVRGVNAAGLELARLHDLAETLGKAGVLLLAVVVALHVLSRPVAAPT